MDEKDLGTKSPFWAKRPESFFIIQICGIPIINSIDKYFEFVYYDNNTTVQWYNDREGDRKKGL